MFYLITCIWIIAASAVAIEKYAPHTKDPGLKFAKRTIAITFSLGTVITLHYVFKYPMGGFFILIYFVPIVAIFSFVAGILKWSGIALFIKKEQPSNSEIATEANLWGRRRIVSAAVLSVALVLNIVYGVIYLPREAKLRRADSSQTDPTVLESMAKEALKDHDYQVLRLIASNSATSGATLKKIKWANGRENYSFPWLWPQDPGKLDNRSIEQRVGENSNFIKSGTK